MTSRHSCGVLWLTEIIRSSHDIDTIAISNDVTPQLWRSVVELFVYEIIFYVLTNMTSRHSCVGLHFASRKIVIYFM